MRTEFRQHFLSTVTARDKLVTGEGVGVIGAIIYLFIYLFAQAHTSRTMRQGLEHGQQGTNVH